MLVPMTVQYFEPTSGVPIPVAETYSLRKTLKPETTPAFSPINMVVTSRRDATSCPLPEVLE